MPALNEELIAAYQNTIYRVGTGPHSFSIRIGQESQEIKVITHSSRDQGAIFITAFNPMSEQVTQEMNANAQANLQKELDRLGAIVTGGVGEDPLGQWPAEASFFAVGINALNGVYLGLRFRQHAIVWIGDDSLPIIVLLKQELSTNIFKNITATFEAGYQTICEKFIRFNSLGRRLHSHQFPSLPDSGLKRRELQEIETMSMREPQNFLNWLYERRIRMLKGREDRFPEYSHRYDADLSLIRYVFTLMIEQYIVGTRPILDFHNSMQLNTQVPEFKSPDE